MRLSRDKGIHGPKTEVARVTLRAVTVVSTAASTDVATAVARRTAISLAMAALVRQQ